MAFQFQDEMKTAELLIAAGKYKEASAELPTDPHHLAILINALDDYSKEFTLCWLNTLLRNPFNLDQLIKPNERTVLEDFLFKKLDKPCSIPLWKLICSNIALLLNNILSVTVISDKCDNLVCFNDGCYILKYKTSLQAFYGIMCQLSKHGGSTSKFIRRFMADTLDRSYNIDMAVSESILNLRYKTKILSYSSSLKTAKDDFEKLIGFISHENAKLGWTISKSIFRISKYLKRELVAECLISSLGTTILGEEQAWINIMSILSRFVLEETDMRRNMKSLALAEKMICNDEEFVVKSAGVREAGLFFIGTFFRSVNLYEQSVISHVLVRIVFMSLFDSSFQCRMAAMAVLKEHVKANFCSIFRQAIELIEQASIKRIKDNFNLFRRIGNKSMYKDCVCEMLYHYTREKRECAAKLIVEYYPLESKNIMKYNTPIEIDGWNLLVSEYNACMVSKTNTEPAYLFITAELDCAKIEKQRNGEYAIESYLRIYKYVNEEELRKNLLFLIGRNCPYYELLAAAVSYVIDDYSFAKNLFKMIRKNCCGLFCNSVNSAHSEEFLEICKENLKKANEPAGTIKALRRFNKNNRACMNELIYSYLYDYSVDNTGDVGYFSRRESLLYFIDQCSEKDFFVGGLLVYFMADKSKKLRDEILLYFITGCFTEFACNFTYLSYKATLLEDKSSLSKNMLVSWGIYDKIKMFFKEHAKAFDRVAPEEAYFTALFAIFGVENNREFSMGIINTMVVSSRSLFGLIVKHIENRLVFYVNTAVESIKIPGRPKLALLRFLLLAVYHFRENSIDKIIEAAIKENDINETDLMNLNRQELGLYEKLRLERVGR
ncbi:hypothetical protein PAEPH01_1059 [Pancytospora epiphaga]|nr:hypothetical protein PAEPH01_1059 [Pancytospora epiphaga]